MMEKMDPMKKALQMRRGQGLDIQILVGPSDEDKKTDLAPKPAAPLAAEGSEEMGEMDPGALDQDMMGDMTDLDKADLEEREPRSLGERARKMAMMRMKK